MMMPEGNCTEVKIPDTELVFTICVDALGLKLIHNNKEVTVDLKDFENPLALRAILDQEFGIDLKDPLNGRIAFYLQQNINSNKLINSLNKDKAIPEPNVCIHFNDRYGECDKEAVLEDDGLKLFNYSFSTEKKEAERVLNDHYYLVKGKIKKIRKIKLKGIPVHENLLKVDIDNTTLIGDLEEILDSLKNFALDHTKRHYVSQFLYDNMTIEEEMYYSPGPWIVSNKIEIAEVPGYLPPWKDFVKYELPAGGNVENGIKLLVSIINGYKNPHKAMAVIAYGIIAWAKHFFVENFQYFPHMVISGPNQTGKSLLVDILRTLYNFWDEEKSPKSDFQLRKILAKTTIPAMFTEGNFFSSFVQANDKLLSTLTVAATSNVILEGGSKEYGGVFLAIRSLIVPANNTDVETLAPYVRDKMIIIDIPRDEGYIDTHEIKTPRRMTKEDKLDMAAIMREVFNIFERKINEIRQALNVASREDAVKYYITLGYSILSEIASKYGIKLPEPYIPGFNESDDDFNEVVKGAFLQFVNEKKQNIIKTSDRDHVDVIDPIDPESALQNYGFFISTKHSTIVFNISLLTEYSMELTRKYGLPKLSWRRISEILGVKRTMLTRYGPTLNNVFEYQFKDNKETYCKSLDMKEVKEEDIEYCKEYGYYDTENKIFRVFNDDKTTSGY
ncbi:hypothetical protein DDW12_08790 [Sulfolobus islandicus]|nr:hypothetical protein DDW12_08790 [Sulfolobus islandicus]